MPMRRRRAPLLVGTILCDIANGLLRRLESNGRWLLTPGGQVISLFKNVKKVLGHRMPVAARDLSIGFALPFPVFIAPRNRQRDCIRQGSGIARVEETHAFARLFHQLSESGNVGTCDGTFVLKGLQERETIPFMEGRQRHEQGGFVKRLNFLSTNDAEKMDVAAEALGLYKL